VESPITDDGDADFETVERVAADVRPG